MQKIAFLALLLLSGCGKEDPRKDFRPDTDYHSQFIGYWRVADENNDVYYIALYPEGIAYNTYGPSGQKGTWQVVATRAEMQFNSGWNSFLFKKCRGFVKLSYAPSTPISGPPQNASPASRVKEIPEQEMRKISG